MNGRGVLLLGVALMLTGAIAIGSAYLIAPTSANTTVPTSWTTMMGGYGGPAMGRSGMMGGPGMMGGTWNGPASAPGPGDAGFVAGTLAAPRVVRVFALPYDRFSPDTVAVKAGETITFEVVSMGPTSHEFMVGPAADVAADKAGTPEIADIRMMEARSITYTFSGAGPFAFACHAPGHYEAGMKGTIVVQ